MTVGVYGLVGGIVKLDDAGLHLSRLEGAGQLKRLLRAFGRVVLVSAPWLMRALSIAGTIAMFLVGGGILTHGFAPLAHGIEALAQRAGGVAGAGPLLQGLIPFLLDAAVGLVAGAVVLLVVTMAQRLVSRFKP